MPWMGTVSARPNIGGIRFTDAERCCQTGDCNPSECGLNLLDVGVFIWPSPFRGGTPSSFRAAVDFRNVSVAILGSVLSFGQFWRV
jgi:hypothetical protein